MTISCSALLYTTNCNPKRHQSVQISKSFGLQPVTSSTVVMVHNPAHDLFSIGHFLCRVRVVDCCDLRNGAERQWFIVATISGNFFLLKSLLAGTTTVMHRYGPNDTYPCVFNMKRITYLYLLADFYDASQFEMINFANVKIEHYNYDPVN